MDLKARGQSAASGQAIARAQPSSLDVRGQRPRDLQERQERRVTVDLDLELPVASHHGEFYV